jgi:hypothetical protein
MSVSSISASTQAEPLLTCLRLEPEAQKLARLQALSAADWQAAIEQARRYDVLALLFWQVRKLAGQTHLPEADWQALHASFVGGMGRSLLLYRQLAEILRRLAAEGIPAILLKGLHLARWTYPELGLRPMADIDLLLRPEQLPQAAEALRGMGYDHPRRFSFSRELRRHQHIPPLCQPGKAPVELHWHIASPHSPLNVDLDGLWERAQAVEVDGAPALTLSTEDLLLHLSLHLLQDEFIGGLKRLYDIAALSVAHGERLDWAQAQRRALAWGCHKSLFLTLHLAHALFDAPVPPGVLQQLRPADFTPQIDALARERALSVRLSPPELHPDLARLRRNRPLRAKAAALLGVLFPYPEYVAAKYSLPPGSKKVYWYYVVRLKDLARRYGWQLWRVLRSDEGAAALAQRENALSDWCMAR